VRKKVNITLHQPWALCLLPLAVLLVAVPLTGCNHEDSDLVVVDVDNPPSAPDGVFSITGDLEVTICWNPNPESDIAGYDIFWNDAPTGFFEYVGSVGPGEFCYVDTDVDYRTTYFYAVLAFDHAGQESELSYEDVFDTPRPEGVGLVLNTVLRGYDFSSLTGNAQAQNDPGTDVYFGAPNGVPTLFADQGAGVDIQDYGYIDLVDVDWAPASGWAPSGRVEFINGHSYVVRIVSLSGAFNMAKVYVVSVSLSSVTLDWAYQLDEDNPELYRVGADDGSPGVGGAQR
jgi:hypothetical protein